MNTSLPFQVPFIRWADVSVVSGRYPMALRRLYDHELIYVMGGSGRIVIENLSLTASPDCLFLIPPRAWHAFISDEGVELPLMGVHFDWVPQHDTLAFPVHRAADEPVQADRFRQVREVPNWDREAMPMLNLKGRPRVRRALEEVIAEYQKHDDESQSVAGALLAGAIGLISREARLAQQLAQSTLAGADAVRRVHRAREILETPRETTLPIDDVAAQVGWSGDHLRRMFRLVLGTSPNTVQTGARLGLAKKLMRAGNLPIATIAARCGFDDASHFARVFKKDSGLSPRQFLALSKKI